MTPHRTDGSAPAGDRIETSAAGGGVELLQARFVRRGYARHRHDSYVFCVTDAGIQAFDYRGAVRRSRPGEVVVLHPDERHDGRPGAPGGFAYRAAHVAPDCIADAAAALCGGAVPLPFLADPVLVRGAAAESLARAIAAGFAAFPAAPEPLAADALIAGLALGLVAADPAIRRRRLGCDRRALERARSFLDAEKCRIVASEELEAATGLGRFALARQFRQAYGTSPYRYLMLRRLDWARGRIRAGAPLADIALAAGFADQAHFSRQFKAAYGLSPARFRAAAGALP